MVIEMMTAEQLKNSILKLALSGKLVPQDKTDEPAQILLKRIREKKKALVKAKVVPKDKNMDNVSEDEQLFDIPDNWIWTRIGELFQHNTGKALNGSNKEGTVLPYITTSNLYWNRFELDNLKEMPFTDAEIEKCTATKGDLLVCEGGDYGRAAIWNYDFDIRIQNHVHKLRAYEELCTEYFYYLFNFLKSTGQIKGKGIAIQGLSSGALHNLVVPLPPLNEQYRIVEKTHEIIPVWEQYATASTKLNTLNTSFPEMMKKSILQEAVQGKLVPQDPNDEPASLLLKKISEEKKRLIKEGKIKKQKPLPEITEDEIPFDIPESWEWIRLGEIGSWSSGATPSRTKTEYYGGDIPWLKTGDLNDGYINEVPERITQLAMDNTSVRLNPIGSVLMAMYGATIGKLGIANIPLTTNQACCACIPYNGIYNRYLFYFLLGMRSTFIRMGEGGAQPNISKEKIINTIMALPPLEEQKRIVNRLDELFPIMNDLVN